MAMLGDYDKDRIKLLVTQRVEGDEMEAGMAILRDLYAARAAAHAPQSAAQNQRSAMQAQAVPVEDVTFEPIRPVRPFQAHSMSRSLRPQTVTPLSTPRRYSAEPVFRPLARAA